MILRMVYRKVFGRTKKGDMVKFVIYTYKFLYFIYVLIEIFIKTGHADTFL